MKRKWIITSIVVVIILSFVGCTPKETKNDFESIYDEIILDGKNTHLSEITYGMTVDDVLISLGLSEDDVILNTYEASYIPDVTEVTKLVTEEIFRYKELNSASAFRKIFEFHDGKLKSVSWNTYLNENDLSKAYDAAMQFIDDFLKKSGATPVENAEGFEYNAYGSTEKADFLKAGGHYDIQFFNGGALAMLSMVSFEPAPSQNYEQDVMIQIGISMNLAWSQNQ